MKNNKNGTILIIGGEGYIGNVLALRFLSNGYKVISYDNFIFENHLCTLNKTHFKNYQFVFGDMLDTKTLQVLLEKVDGVVLLAGLVGDPITKKYPKESAIINDDGVKNVIDLCAERNIEKFIFVSTCSNYGMTDNEKLADEAFDLNPLSLYSKSKVKAENYILSLKDKTEMNPTILRFATAFGLSPRMRFDLTISEFTRELGLGNELLVYDAQTWRPYCHVLDFARLIQIVFEASKNKTSFEIFNAGGEENNATKQMIVDTILNKIPDGIVRYDNFGSDPRNYRVNFKKVKKRFNFELEYTIEDGIVELIYAIKNHVFDRVATNKNFHGNYEINYSVSK
jgi:nucleoside-diphosphate-sugar epimerase